MIEFLKTISGVLFLGVFISLIAVNIKLGRHYNLDPAVIPLGVLAVFTICFVGMAIRKHFKKEDK